MTLFVSGCENHCKGCHNPQTWDPKSGRPFDKLALDKLLTELGKDKCDGLSISGGDPLYAGNLKTISEICRLAKSRCPQKDIALWTGYKFKELSKKQLDALRDVDWVIDGPFIEELKDISLKWRGSSNQRIWKQYSAGLWADCTEEIDADR